MGYPLSGTGKDWVLPSGTGQDGVPPQPGQDRMGHFHPGQVMLGQVTTQVARLLQFPEGGLSCSCE